MEINDFIDQIVPEEYCKNILDELRHAKFPLVILGVAAWHIAYENC